MELFRDSQVSKLQAERFLEFFRSILPIPNSMPRSIDELMSILDINNYFNTRIICSLCGSTLDLKVRRCLSCPEFHRKNLIFIYDTHFPNIFLSILNKLTDDIKNYKKKIISGNSDVAYDIPFASTYQDLLKKNCEQKPFKLNFSSRRTFVIELPPTLRYRRANMPLISMWVACKEPGIHLWLNESVQMLKLLKTSGILVNDFTSKINVYGHLGKCILDSILDVPLPTSIICDYGHVSLLRHFKDVIRSIGRALSPSLRKTIDSKLRRQVFPLYFKRKMRGIEELSYIKASEIKNILLYGFLPHFHNVLPCNVLGHIALFICGVRLLHSSHKKVRESTDDIANELLKMYHEHHNFYYTYMENFVLHLHAHYFMNYKLHGSLTYVNTFAQEDLMGSIASDRNGTYRNIYENSSFFVKT
ncbi:unnamed protein product [Rotaria socialis]|uniref:Uncharacterized protein n=1 Tax=Rotaria socialis TaxID=392032 RepID=A0A817ZMY5_9BILA|nr:unnamed protein product [Rotaria socialis]CAF4327510.1 unnamed protein product [Rotaria socialis]